MPESRRGLMHGTRLQGTESNTRKRNTEQTVLGGASAVGRGASAPPLVRIRVRQPLDAMLLQARPAVHVRAARLRRRVGLVGLLLRVARFGTRRFGRARNGRLGGGR
jgi:hypothetical protein